MPGQEKSCRKVQTMHETTPNVRQLRFPAPRRLVTTTPANTSERRQKQQTITQMQPFQAIFHSHEDKENLIYETNDEPSYAYSNEYHVKPTKVKRRRTTGPEHTSPGVIRNAKACGTSSSTIESVPGSDRRTSTSLISQAPTTPIRRKIKEVPCSQSPLGTPLSPCNSRLRHADQASPLMKNRLNKEIPRPSSTVRRSSRTLDVSDSVEDEEIKEGHMDEVRPFVDRTQLHAVPNNMSSPTQSSSLPTLTAPVHAMKSEIPSSDHEDSDDSDCDEVTHTNKFHPHSNLYASSPLPCPMLKQQPSHESFLEGPHSIRHIPPSTDTREKSFDKPKRSSVQQTVSEQLVSELQCSMRQPCHRSMAQRTRKTTVCIGQHEAKATDAAASPSSTHVPSDYQIFGFIPSSQPQTDAIDIESQDPGKFHVKSSQATTIDASQSSLKFRTNGAHAQVLSSSPPTPRVSMPVTGAHFAPSSYEWREDKIFTDSQLLPAILMDELMYA